MHNYLTQWLFIIRLVGKVLPAVEKELQTWKHYLQTCPSPFLQKQALQSIRNKRFHCQGGAAFSLLHPSAAEKLIPMIVAYQTISDYLDNLCDRVPLYEDLTYLTDREKDGLKERGLRHLHLSMLRAIQLSYGKNEDFYRFYPVKGDGGYLDNLVKVSREMLSGLPGYMKVKDKIFFLAALYSDLQALKHLSPKNRSCYLMEWFQRYRKAYPCLYWNEFSAACGSTLGIFVLLSSASRQDITTNEVEALFNGYFPWICGLHILLDYFIDQEEDRREKDLNFVSFYRDKEQCLCRMEKFVKKALAQARKMPQPLFHCTIVKGLLALYLSDPKIISQDLEKSAFRLLAATGERDTFAMLHTCRLLRSKGLI